MTLADLANLGEFVGGIVVVITLVFLVFQIRANTNSIKLAASVAWRETYADVAGDAGSVPELVQALKKVSLKEELTVDDRYHLRLWVQRSLVQTEVGLLLLRSGQLDPKIFNAIWIPMKAYLRQPEIVKIYELLRDRFDNFGPEMREFFENEIKEAPNERS